MSKDKIPDFTAEQWKFIVEMKHEIMMEKNPSYRDKINRREKSIKENSKPKEETNE